MASDIWLRTIPIVRKETCCHHIGYSYWLTARVLLYAPSHRQDNTYHGLCYTSRGALAGTRNSSMAPRSDAGVFSVETEYQFRRKWVKDSRSDIKLHNHLWKSYYFSSFLLLLNQDSWITQRFVFFLGICVVGSKWLWSLTSLRESFTHLRWLNSNYLTTCMY